MWAALAARAKDIYQPDITIGEETHLRGHWLDRLAAMDDDIADMAGRLEQTRRSEVPQDRIQSAIREALGRPRRASVPCRHEPPSNFRPGQPLPIVLSLEKPGAVSVLLYYRHVNQAERYVAAPMEKQADRFRAAIPATYTESPYPLQYYFELSSGPDTSWLYPGFGVSLANQPYFTVRRARE